MSEQEEQRAAPLPNRIGELRKARGWTLAELARQAGTSAQQMGRLEAGHRRLTQGWMMKISAALGTMPGDLLPLRPTAGAAPSHGAAGQGAYVAPFPLAYVDVPVRVTKPADEDFLVAPVAIEYVLRPSPLMGAVDGFAFRVVGRSMEPAYGVGDLVFADPRLEPRVGNDVVLIAAPNHYAPVPALLGRLEAIGEDTIRLRLFRSQETRTELRSAWPNVTVVVGCFRAT